ncbi:helix-turn-helix domain-containing protein [Flavobacterium quisquiliarum]|uniref:Helix-turn-helix domain-containing protein n=1 Tax=Flavobacterium quisquiliarum TaxID=1834436 RepID=A0ABV8VYT8_9FLAO|nr:AraC family transcriptional regulator [Flavobacterium quisquiliarum]MBW1653886.1 AraC family transcriptional regulator [Flavobacterium quisquiliarum]NWL01525.1 transcriptional regulator [Flavobacterium collinsii]
MHHDLEYKSISPPQNLAAFVDSFWCMHNKSDKTIETIGLPDGRIDLSLFQSSEEPFRITLLGLGTHQYEKGKIPANSLTFVISFKLPAVEYIFHEPIVTLLNDAKILGDDFWGFKKKDLENFELFCEKASQKLESLIVKEMDSRKQKLFNLIYESNGAMTVKDLAQQSNWSSRQINRYFNQYFGISLKGFCSILRFRASLEHIAKGKLFPEENFSDQTHFIKEIKKISGSLPKELFQNKNDRFILLSALSSK